MRTNFVVQGIAILTTSRYHAYAKDLNPDLQETLNDMNFRLFESGLEQDRQDVRALYNSPYPRDGST